MEIKGEVKANVKVTVETTHGPKIDELVTPKGKGMLDMVIAFDTTGSMAAYIDDVRQQVKDLIPRLFRDNDDLQLGIVAFGDYCDMENPSKFGDAYQCLPLTNNENDLIRFVNEARNTSGGDGDEFYELVLQKIIDEMPWREDASKAILLIADANPHPVGYSFRDYVQGNQIDWRAEARKAADKMIKIDTVSILGLPWYQEVADMTNGVCVPFKSSGKTATFVETAATARSSMAYTEYRKKHNIKDMSAKERHLRDKLSFMHDSFCHDAELGFQAHSYKEKLDELDETV